jgi:4-hydroxy-tetrahydrodipicolinate synthase
MVGLSNGEASRAASDRRRLRMKHIICRGRPLASGLSARRASSARENLRTLALLYLVTDATRSLGARARALAGQLDGTLVPAVPVPRRASGHMHAEAQAAYAMWMAPQPVGGVAVWAHTGRGQPLDAETRAQVLTSWRTALPSPAVIIAGCGVPANGAPLPSDPRTRTDQVIRRTVTMAEEARKGGADALLVHPPGQLAALPDASGRVLALHDALAEAALPLIGFLLYRRASGLEYDDALLDEVLALPHVVGLKLATLDSVMRFQTVADRMSSHHADRLLITGEDRFLGYSLMIGARCALIGMGAARTGMQGALVRAAIANDAPSLLRLTRACDRFAAATFIEPMEGYIRRMLWALAEDGIIPDEACHDPSGPDLGPDDRARVASVMRALDGVS